MTGVNGVSTLKSRQSRNRAGVTQLVESLPSKQVVAGSSPVPRSTGSGRDPALALTKVTSEHHGSYTGPMIKSLSEALAAYNMIGTADGLSPTLANSLLSVYLDTTSDREVVSL